MALPFLEMQINGSRIGAVTPKELVRQVLRHLFQENDKEDIFWEFKRNDIITLYLYDLCGHIPSRSCSRNMKVPPISKMTLHRIAWPGKPRHHAAWQGQARPVLARPGLARPGLAWPGLASPGMSWRSHFVVFSDSFIAYVISVIFDSFEQCLLPPQI